MIKEGVPLDALPASSLGALLTAYQSEVKHMASTEESSCFPCGACAAAELQALQRLVSRTPVLEFVSCSNSPFFSAVTAAAPLRERLNYALRIAHTIIQPTYSRYMKVLMLLLREMRFAVLLCDAQFFAQHPAHSLRSGAASLGGAAAVAGGNTIGKLADAFQRIGSRRYYSAAQLLSQRVALAKNKNSHFTKALSGAFAELKGWIGKVCNAYLLVRDASRMKAVLQKCPKLSFDVSAAITAVEAIPVHAIVAFFTDVAERVRACAETHKQDASGSDLFYFCGRVRDAALKACGTLKQAEGRAVATHFVEPTVMVQCLTTGGGLSIVEAALLQFVDVADRVDELAPELSAMNFLLDLYGVEAAEALAHAVDVVDGNFKRLVGDVFEAKSFDAEQQILAQQVLIPHCCAVTGCSEPTAQAWVLACLRAPPPIQWGNGRDVSSDESKMDLSAWTGTTGAAAPLPPHYCLVRNVPYRWNTAGRASLPPASGELDGVVFDARTRQVLFVLEAKHNIADLGKACKQKERLYKALDLAWATRAMPVAPPPAAASLPSADGTQAETAASSNVQSCGVVQLEFSVSVGADAATAVSVKAQATTRSNSEEEEEEAGGEGASVDEGADGAISALGFSASPTAAAAMRTVCFTQDNFTEHFGATAATRESRFVYLSTIHANSVEALESTAPAPGGEMYLVESALISAIGDSISSGYQAFCQSGRLPQAPCAELKTVFTLMQQSSFYVQCVRNRLGNAGIARVPRFQLSLSFPAAAMVRHPNAVPAETLANPYEYALHLWRDNVELEDGTAAIRHVKLCCGFLSELRISDRSLTYAIDSVARRHGKADRATPSFAAVAKSLMDMHCVRNLVVVTDDESA